MYNAVISFDKFKIPLPADKSKKLIDGKYDGKTVVFGILIQRYASLTSWLPSGHALHNYALYPHMTVFDNMAFGLKLRKVPKEEIKQKVEAAAKILDLDKLLERKPKALSGGQRQRVARV